MRKTFAVVVMLLGTSYGSGVVAQTYVRAGVGVSINDSNSRTYDTGAQRVHADMEPAGLNLTASIGYDLGSVRAELQGQYSRTKPFNQGCFTCGIATAPYVEDTAEIGGSDTAKMAFVNALYDFPAIGDFLQFSVGGGVGVADVKVRTASNGYVPFQKGNATKIAGQAIVEARVRLSDKTAISLRYSYQHLGKVKVDMLSGSGVLLATSNRAHNYQNYSIGIEQQF